MFQGSKTGIIELGIFHGKQWEMIGIKNNQIIWDQSSVSWYNPMMWEISNQESTILYVGSFSVTLRWSLGNPPADEGFNGKIIEKNAEFSSKPCLIPCKSLAEKTRIPYTPDISMNNIEIYGIMHSQLSFYEYWVLGCLGMSWDSVSTFR